MKVGPYCGYSLDEIIKIKQMKGLKKTEMKVNLNDYVPFTSKEMAPSFDIQLANVNKSAIMWTLL